MRGRATRISRPHDRRMTVAARGTIDRRAMQSPMSPPRVTTGTAITGAGVWHPEHVLSNEELCVAFNEFARRANAAGAQPPIKESTPELIVRASGIKRRYLVDKVGVLDPERMCPSGPERADDPLSVQAELAVHAVSRARAP